MERYVEEASARAGDGEAGGHHPPPPSEGLLDGAVAGAAQRQQAGGTRPCPAEAPPPAAAEAAARAEFAMLLEATRVLGRIQQVVQVGGCSPCLDLT